MEKVIVVVRYISNKKGSALVFVVIFMLVMAVLGTAIMGVAVTENRFSIQHENKLQAYYIARSGAQAVAEYMIKDKDNDAADIIGKTSALNNQIGQDGNGNFAVTVTEDLVNNTVNIVSTAYYNGVQQEAKIVVSRSVDGIGGIFQHAIVAKNNISVDGNGNKTVITGTVATKTGTIYLNKATSDGEIVDPNLIFPPIIQPPDRTPAVPYDLIIGNIGYNTSVSAMNSNSVTYVKTGSIYRRNNTIRVTGSGIVHMYVEGDIVLDTNSRFNVDSTAKLYIYVIGKRNVTLQGNGAQNNVFLYAPDSDIVWNNAQPNNDFYGAMIGNSVTLFNQLTIRHNPDMVNDIELDTTGAGVTFTGYKWID